jgi:1-deoxy-D-xylulose-5-phosphate reductoisomerase
VFNAANEVAVEAFLDQRIAFLDIADVVAATLSAMNGRAATDLDDLTAIDAEARTIAAKALARP